jgi:hypothetical protein
LSSGITASTLTPTTAGNLLVVIVEARNVTTLPKITAMADTANDTFRKVASTSRGTQTDEEIWEVPLSAGGAQMVTATLSVNSSLAITVVEVSGAGQDASGSNAGTSNAASTGTATTRQGGELAIACLGWNSTAAVSAQSAGYTLLPTQQATIAGSQVGEQAAYGFVPAVGAASYSATLSGSFAWTGVIVTLT